MELDVTLQPKEQTCAGSRTGCLFQDAVSSKSGCGYIIHNEPGAGVHLTRYAKKENMISILQTAQWEEKVNLTAFNFLQSHSSII